MNDMSPDHQQLTTGHAPLASQASHVTARMRIMERLHNAVHLNDFGLPTAAYRPDLIPGDLFDRPQAEQTDILQLATVPIVYEGGLPVVEGRLYWEQFPWEPKDDYARFTDYRRLQETYGYRSINLLVQPPEKGVNDEGDDEAQLLKDQKLLERLRQQYTYYAWGFRVKAYDMVGVVAYDRLRERRAMETENHHYIKLDGMFKQFSSHWKKITNPVGDDPSAWDELGIMDTLKAMKSIMELQRVSAGLPASAPLTPKEAGGDPLRGHSMETRLKSHAKQQSLLEDSNADELLGAEELLKNPRLLAMAQELILSASTPKGDPNDPNDADISGIDTGDIAAQELAESQLEAQSQIVPDHTNGQTNDD